MRDAGDGRGVPRSARPWSPPCRTPEGSPEPLDGIRPGNLIHQDRRSPSRDHCIAFQDQAVIHGRNWTLVALPWTLLARLAVIPWTLVAHTNN